MAKLSDVLNNVLPTSTIQKVENATDNSMAQSIVMRDSNGGFVATLITTDITGNAATASKLQTPRTIALTGDVTGSGVFDGSENLTIVTHLPNTTAGTVTEVVYNGVQSAITVTKADTGKVFVSEIGSLGKAVYTLPATTAGDTGIQFTFAKIGDGSISIKASGDDVVADSSVGGEIYNNFSIETYATITLLLVRGNRWIIMGAHGTWSTT